MRLFWKVFAILWLATLMVGGSGFLVSRALQQDWLLLQFHPQLKDFAEELVTRYETDGPSAAQRWLDVQREEYRLRAQLFDTEGLSLLPGTLPRRPIFQQSTPPNVESREIWHGRLFQLDWLSAQGDYHLSLFVPRDELFNWRRTPVALILNIFLAMALLGIISLLLSRYLTGPLRQLGLASQSLAKGRFEAEKLERIGRRSDEIGDLSRHFSHMAQRVQDLLDSQRQLMRDISHELRSPLARLRVGLALGSKQGAPAEDPLWSRLDRECTRLDLLIEDILTLSRQDIQDHPPCQFALDNLVAEVIEDNQFVADTQEFELVGSTLITLEGWPEQLRSALDNLLRNALRFSPTHGVIRVSLATSRGQCQISVEDQGPGVDDQWLQRLGEPFLRLPGQTGASGHGLGLAIARRAIAMHGGSLTFSRSAMGGLRALIQLPGQT
ncbi:MAG: HAMP domain-containing protein [Pseudomonas sp.]|uniref:ATP-binding protein n=1 Tax=Halopseudomonas laoshanensis TaxID=2268758 RepID=UPI001B42DF70|nr:HAMP domain-containing protein [Pseudomonas sp.]MBQ0776019.1 HAMP domain-containing protein [Pseudomonas sp.]